MGSYLYACITVIGKNAYIIMHVDDEAKACEVLTKANIKLVTDKELKNLA